MRHKFQGNKLGPGYWAFGIYICHDPNWHETYIRLGLIKYEVLIGSLRHYIDNG